MQFKINWFTKFKLDFIIAGTQKGGTSVLDHYLRQHPQICMGKKKELHFFDREKNFRKSKIPYQKLHRGIIRKPCCRFYGEATPIYMFWGKSMERIKTYNPEIKLIFILRNPSHRAFSHWNMEVQKGKEEREFLEALEQESNELKRGYVQHRVFSYLSRGLYSVQIKKLFSLFPEEQLLFIPYEDFKNKQEETLLSILGFIGADSDKFKYHPAVVHKRKYSREMNIKEKEFLSDFFRADIAETEKLLQWDCSAWKYPAG